MLRAPMNRFRPYFALLRKVKGRFLAGIAAGFVFAVASGFGMPFVVEKVFPVPGSEKSPPPPRPR